MTARWATPKRPRTAANSTRSSYRINDDSFTARSAPFSADIRQPASHSEVQSRTAKPAIRLVRQLEALDPFDDPFGDAAEPRHEVDFQAPGGLLPAPLEVPTAIQADPVEEQPGRQPLTDPAPLPPPAEQAEFGDRDDEKPCDRLYNKRDCCAVDEACRDAHDATHKSIRNISVDITPQLTLAKLSSSSRTYEEELEMNLAEAPSRLWRNRRGEAIADGRLVDFRDGRVVIQQDDGDTVRIPFSQLSDDDSCFMTAWWSIPSECKMREEQFAERNWIATTMTWKASALCHKPLYFENVQLERYGHTAGPVVQPVLSGAHFFLNVAALPYKMGINPPTECQFALGYYRPGNCAPWLMPPIPLSIRGAIMEAAAITGGIFVIP